jgi:hypothetical protein
VKAPSLAALILVAWESHITPCQGWNTQKYLHKQVEALTYWVDNCEKLYFLYMKPYTKYNS